MSAPQPRPRLKSPSDTTTVPHPADQTTPPTSDSGPKEFGRQAVLSSLRPDPQTNHGVPEQQVVVAWLRISAPATRRGLPTAESWCRCGQHHTATGKAAVLRLQDTHAAHRETCPLRQPTTEGRNAHEHHPARGRRRAA